MDNWQAQAYAVIAMKEKGYSAKQIDEIKWAMHSVMDRYSETEAERKADIILSEEE